MTRAAVVILLLSATANAAPMMRMGDNLSGWNYPTPENPGGYTEQPFAGPNPGAPGAILATPALEKVNRLSPFGGEIRWMDGMQTVGSDQGATANDRSTNNLSARGVMWETIASVSNQTHNAPWVNTPQKSGAYFDNPANPIELSYPYQMGRTIALGMDPRLKYLKEEYSNELWNSGDQLQGTANLIRARAHPLTTPGADDFKKVSEMAYIDFFRTAVAFKAGVDSTNKGFEVRFVAPGFIANDQYSKYGIDRLRIVFGADPRLNEVLGASRIGVAPYAPGAPSDIGNVQANDTPATIMQRTRAFVEAHYPGWLKRNHDTAVLYGLRGLDYYETMALSTYDFTSGTNLLVDIARSNDPTARDFMRWFFDYAADGVDGVIDGKNADPDAVMMIFGSGGIPYSEPFGQWAPWESYLSGDTAKPLGILDFVASHANNEDPFNVPEPNGAVIAVVIAAGLMAGRRGKAA